MILKGSQRGGAKQLAAHLLNARDNEHVEVHELRGFMAQDLTAALQEVHAVSRGTRAKQFLFSLSLNPPGKERVRVEDYEAAIDTIEERLGLSGQARAIVFHEKDGRRHAHVVWSRIDTGQMKAINLPHFKMKLRDVSRQLYIDHGWTMPKGLTHSRERDPTTFTRAEWEQAKRAKASPKALKAMFTECWAVSDGRKAFVQALAARGYTLARGDRRGFVAVDFRGQCYNVAKWAGFRAKEARAKLGDGKDLPTVEQAVKDHAARMTQMLRGHVAKADATHARKAERLAHHRREIVERQRGERAELKARHDSRKVEETAARTAKLSRGFRGLWDRMTGKYAKQARENQREAEACNQRDRTEREQQIASHLAERRDLHTHAKQVRAAHARDVESLHRDIAELGKLRPAEQARVLQEREEEREGRGEDRGRGESADGSQPPKDRGPDRSPGRGRGPKFER